MDNENTLSGLTISASDFAGHKPAPPVTVSAKLMPVKKPARPLIIGIDPATLDRDLATAERKRKRTLSPEGQALMEQARQALRQRKTHR